MHFCIARACLQKGSLFIVFSMYRYRSGLEAGEAAGKELFSAPALQRSLGTARRHQTQEALRKRLAPVKAIQLACRLAKLVLAGATDASVDEATLDLARPEPVKDYTVPPAQPPPSGGPRAYTAPPPSPRFMVRAGAGGGAGGRQRALGG